MKRNLIIAFLLLLFACSQNEKPTVKKVEDKVAIQTNQWFDLYQINQLLSVIDPYFPEIFSPHVIDSLKLKSVLITTIDSPGTGEVSLVNQYDMYFKQGHVEKCIESIFYDAKTRWKRSLLYLQPADGLHYPVSHTFQDYSSISDLLGMGGEIFMNTDIPFTKATYINDSLLRIQVWDNKKTIEHFYSENPMPKLNADSLKAGTFFHVGSPTRIERTAEKLPLNLWLTIFSVEKDSKTGFPLFVKERIEQNKSQKTFQYNANGLFDGWIDSLKFHGILLRTSQLKVSYDSITNQPQQILLTHFPVSGEPYIGKRVIFEWK
ncbi:MAG: hypothetical protein ABI207_05205 [Crocinitomicaceae bacterium]